MSLQLDIDYMNEAQYRVAADTLCLEKQATLTIPAGETNVSLPDDVITIRSLVQGTTLLNEITTRDIVTLQSAVSLVDVSDRTSYALVGRTLHVTPAPSQPLVLSIIYTARPAPYQSNHDLETLGESKVLVERLVAAMRLQDDGQPERAASELYGYSKDARRQRLQGATTGPSRMLTLAYDKL